MINLLIFARSKQRGRYRSDLPGTPIIVRGNIPIICASNFLAQVIISHGEIIHERDAAYTLPLRLRTCSFSVALCFIPHRERNMEMEGGRVIIFRNIRLVNIDAYIKI